MTDFLLFLAVGFLAQLIDGALGMAYGVISTTVLLSTGVSPAVASATTHSAEVFTTAASGAAHVANRNVDWKLFARLVPFGIIGGVVGSYLLTNVDGEAARPFVAGYLAILGLYLVRRSFREVRQRRIHPLAIPPFGLAGGFLDATGGGGWGPIVTTGLLGVGGEPRYVIGTVNAAEFLVTLAVSLTFLFALLTGRWEEGGNLSSYAASIAGLVVGGVLAAPLAGYVVRMLPAKLLMRIVGILICLLALSQFIGLLRG